jgi:acylphosphatase
MVFYGRTDMDIQGAYFRQLVKEVAVGKDFGVNGHVRNLKNGSVEVLCDCESDKADALFQSIIFAAKEKRIKVDESKWQKPTQELYHFDGFEIIREDDLKEMVWALQGAGKIFKEQEDVNKEEALMGLEYELRSISDSAQRMHKDKKIRKFRTISLENILKAPPLVLGLQVVPKITDLYESCLEINLNNHGSFDDEVKNNLTKIIDLAGEIEVELKKKRLNTSLGVNK